jgi:hypothetical protein
MRKRNFLYIECMNSMMKTHVSVSLKETILFPLSLKCLAISYTAMWPTQLQQEGERPRRSEEKGPLNQ